MRSVLFMALAALFASHVAVLPARAETTDASAQRARVLWDRLVGSYGPADAAKLAFMTELVRLGKVVDAADLAVRDRRFIDVVLPRMVLPWTNQATSSAFPYNGMVALVQGVVRDGIVDQNGEGDFRRAFFGDFQYHIRPGSVPGVTFPPLDIKNESHFDAMVGFNLSANDTLEIQRPQWPLSPGKAAFSGVLTVGAARFLYDGGTNRRPFDWLVRTSLCLDMNILHDNTRGDRWVRQDVDRTDMSTYSTKCIGCHGLIDAATPAFAYLDTTTLGGDKFVTFYSSGIASKYTHNSQVFPDGNVTTSDQWENRATANQNLAIGWRGPTTGSGVPALAEMFANSEQFSRCMAEHVWNTVCLRPPTDNERAQVLKQLAVDAFESKNYRLHELFKAIAAVVSCTGGGT